MKLIDIKEIKGTIELLSGLHIGAGDTEMHIGGTDNPVVRHPHTDEPYIPGSSLKGKVRSLLELKSGLMANTGGSPVKIGDLKRVDGNSEAENILKLFGSGGDDKEDSSAIGPTRVSFADCMLTDEWKKSKLSKFEVKAENTINRISGTASNPRQTERVPAGISFDFSINLKVFDNEGDSLLDYLLEGLKLLEHDALGGSGSRGYGRVKFHFDDAGLKDKFDNLKVF
ncbi:MAG TPA: type III-A CRISPR-associated RAMP protein Csm3 [Desulfomonilia bacterium]